MPTYDYRCLACAHQVEVMHSIAASGPTTCDVCGGAMRKALSTPAIHFKGSGWAKKDAQAASSAKAKNAGTAGDAAGDAAATADSADKGGKGSGSDAAAGPAQDAKDGKDTKDAKPAAATTESGSSTKTAAGATSD